MLQDLPHGLRVKLHAETLGRIEYAESVLEGLPKRTVFGLGGCCRSFGLRLAFFPRQFHRGSKVSTSLMHC